LSEMLRSKFYNLFLSRRNICNNDIYFRLTVTDSDGVTNSTIANVTVIKGKSH
jgi:hypothetical protein